VSIITFFNGSYCGADDIIRGVAQSLDYDEITENLFDKTAQTFDIDREKSIRALYGPPPFFNKLTHERRKVLACLKVVLSEMIQSDNCIITGCVGHLIPRTISHILRVCVIANHEYRVRQAVAETGKSEKEAEKQIHADDKRNFGCTTYLFDKTAYDESLYDVVVPMQDRSVEEAVRMITEYARRDPVRTTDRSRQAARDFVLSAQVNLALVDQGHRTDAHSEDGNVVILINEYVVRMQRHEEKLAAIASKIPGVKNVTTRIGPKYKAPSINPWADIEGPPKILLVDDEKEFVHTLSERLRTRDIDSAIAYDGEQALDMLKEDVPDVMVLDLMMPGIDGIEVLRRIKRDYPQVEVIILTGHGSKREEELADELGAFAYLNKPVDVDRLAQVMKAAYKKANRSTQDGQSGAEN
jgi:CheY-like chemotaxis protein